MPSDGASGISPPPGPEEFLTAPLATEAVKKKNKRRRKKKPARRESFAASGEGIAANESSRASHDVLPSPSAAKPQLYKLGQSGRNLSDTSLDSQALLDHRYMLPQSKKYSLTIHLVIILRCEREEKVEPFSPVVVDIKIRVLPIVNRINFPSALMNNSLEGHDLIDPTLLPKKAAQRKTLSQMPGHHCSLLLRPTTRGMSRKSVPCTAHMVCGQSIDGVLHRAHLVRVGDEILPRLGITQPALIKVTMSIILLLCQIARYLLPRQDLIASWLPSLLRTEDWKSGGQLLQLAVIKSSTSTAAEAMDLDDL